MLIRAALLAGLTTTAVAAAAPDPAAARGCAHSGAPLSAMSLAQARSSTLCLLNVQRRRHGLKPLYPSTKLRRAADRHSRDMVVHRYFAHGNFIGRIASVGYLAGARSWRVGENIAYARGASSSPGHIVSLWMHSPPHRHNILTGSFRHVGVGIARGTPTGGPGGTYTTDFGAHHY